jgi:hypothetical protein
MANDAKGAAEKKPYLRPELECVSVFEAAAATCCKATNTACSTTGRAGLGKDQRRMTVS